MGYDGSQAPKPLPGKHLGHQTFHEFLMPKDVDEGRSRKILVHPSGDDFASPLAPVLDKLVAPSSLRLSASSHG